MIAVDEAQRLRELPAKSRKELLSRLELHVGRVLKIEGKTESTEYNYYGYGEVVTQHFTEIGELLWLRGVKGGKLKLKLRGAPKRVKLKLSYSVSVLTDGQWVLIHSPESKPEQPQEEEEV